MITAQNNLPSVSQQWAAQMQRATEASERSIANLQAAVDTLIKSQAATARSVGNMNIKVVPLDARTPANYPAATDLYLQIETPVDTNYDYMILSAQFGTQDYFTASGSERRSKIYAGWNDYAYPITSIAQNILIVPAGEDDSFESISVSGVFKTSEWTGQYTPHVYGGSYLQSVVSGYQPDGRITGSLIYFKEQS